MALDIDQLVADYEGYDKIPNDLLYQYLDEHREDLINEAKLGVERLPTSKLGKEVRRRCKTDLIWLARYFTWISSPYSENGFLPISGNMFLEENYEIFTKLFTQKDETKPISAQSEIKTRLLLWPRGGAKALDISTLIPTPTGFQKMEDIQVGDYVYGENGEEVQVIGVSEIFQDRPCYEVAFSSGETIIADEGHLWETDAKRDRENKPRKLVRGTPSPSVKTTKQIADTLLIRKERNHRIKVAGAVEGREHNLPLPAYVLGCWLGDGTSSCASFTCADDDSQIIDEIRKEGVPVTKGKPPLRWNFNGGEDHPDFRKHKTGFTSQLRKLGVLRNKHIPEIYLRASYEQRLSLLQGLMDTDGTIYKNGKCYFCNTNKKLAKQAKELIASLGFKPSIATGKAVLNGTVIGDSYKVFFQPYEDQPVFRLKRKKDRLTHRKKVSLQDYRTIVAVNKVESRPVKCIMVDSESHLYLAGEGFIPTHNSTFDHIDTVQWILNFPSIRICYLTATKDLAEGFVGEIKGHFYFKEEPTWMNLFFPEFCVEEGDAGAKNVFTCPVFAAKKTGRKEATVIASSIGKAKAGWRFELIKADDAVSDVNSETSEGCDKISNALMLAEKLLPQGGFYVDFIGTRYAEEDHYGVLLEQNKTGELTATKGHGWEMTENLQTATKILIGRAMTIKPEIVQKMEEEGKVATYQDAGPDGVILLRPEMMSYKWCMADFTKNEKSFEGQRNQNPRPASQVTFDRPLLLRNTIPHTEMPNMGVVTQVWDFAFSKKKGADFSTGCSIMWAERDVVDQDGKKTGEKKTVGYVHDIVRDRFNTLTLAQAVVALAQKHKPFTIGIENVGGAQLLTETLRSEAIKTKDLYTMQVINSIDWFAPDNQKDAKKIRMATLYPELMQGQLKFANYCMQPNLNAMYDEFERCLTSHNHDDIPDVISMQMRYKPRAYLAIAENNEEAMSRIDPMWNQIFVEGTDPWGRVGYGAPSLPLTPFAEEDLFIEEEPMQYFKF